MRTIRLGLLLLSLLASGGALSAQIVVYSFASSAAPTSVAANLSASVFSGSLGSPATGSGNPLYAAGSGGGYFTASAWTGAAPGTNYFEVTLTPGSGHGLALASLSFGYRATGTGPTAFAVRSSADAFSSTLVSGTITNDSVWHATGPLSITLSSLTAATTLRIYAAGASSSLGTLRVDDVSLGGSVTAIPEASTYATVLGLLALTAALRHRRRPRPAG
jgi:MYXO-CTERM domain-containing protein